MKISNHTVWARQRTAGVLGIPLKEPTYSLTADGLIFSELQWWGSGSKTTRDIWGVTELSGFGVRVVEAPFSGTKLLTDAIVPLLSTPSTQHAGTGGQQI